MRKEIIICDKCGKEIDGDLWCCHSNSVDVDYFYDFCMECMDMFVKTDPEPKPKRQPRKIDRGKVWALKDADWKVSAIAGEIGCSEATIYNILNEGRPS